MAINIKLTNMDDIPHTTKKKYDSPFPVSMSESDQQRFRGFAASIGKKPATLAREILLSYLNTHLFIKPEQVIDKLRDNESWLLSDERRLCEEGKLTLQHLQAALQAILDVEYKTDQQAYYKLALQEQLAALQP